MKSENSLVIVKNGIMQKIQKFLLKIFKKKVQNNITKVENIENEKTEEIKDLINKIKSGEINLGIKEDKELEELKNKLVKYLKIIKDEINIKKEKISQEEGM